MMANAEPDDHQASQADESDDEEALEEHPYATGINGVLDAVANVIEKDRFVEALSAWVDSYAQKVKGAGEKAKTEDRYRWHAYWMSLVFSLAIFRWAVCSGMERQDFEGNGWGSFRFPNWLLVWTTAEKRRIVKVFSPPPGEFERHV